MRKEMNSPMGKRGVMKKVSLEEGLVAYECGESGGVYITLQDYWNWLKKQPERLAHLPASDDGKCVVEVEAVAKLCPETGTIMMRCKVGNDFDFYIDRSQAGGVWLDAGEWDALKGRNFHDELHLVFTEPWQEKLRERQAEMVSRKMLNEKLGEELLEKIEEMKAALEGHAYRDYAIAYLGEG